MRASAVPTCCPISARMMLTVTMPSRSMLYQIVGSNALCVGTDVAATSPSVGAKPKTTTVPTAPIRKPRRDSARVWPAARYWSLAIGSLLPKFGSGLFDGFADADVSHAAAEIAGHHAVYVLVAWRWKILQQCRRLHDLAGLTVAALRNL